MVEVQVNLLPVPNKNPNIMNEIRCQELNEMTLQMLEIAVAKRRLKLEVKE
jgi:hypothetical protein